MNLHHSLVELIWFINTQFSFYNLC